MSCLQSFTTEEILSNHKKQRLLISGCQAVNLESGIIKSTDHNKQMPILNKIYADTECFLKRTKIEEGEHMAKYQEYQPNSVGAIDLLYLLSFLKVKIVLINLLHGY